MIIIDFIFKGFHIYLRKYGNRGIEAAIMPMSISITFLVLFMISYFLYEFKAGFTLIDITPIGMGILLLIIYLLISNLLDNVYLRRGKNIQYGRRRFIYYPVGPILFFTSIFLLVYSFRFITLAKY